jgi:hypothetical protein
MPYLSAYKNLDANEQLNPQSKWLPGKAFPVYKMPAMKHLGALSAPSGQPLVLQRACQIFGYCH